MNFLKVAIALVFVFGVIGALAFYLFGERTHPDAISTKGGESLEINIPCPYFAQKDSRWKDEELGASGDSLGSYGCTLCSSTMALNAYGIKCDPKILNSHLSENGGYTENGLLIWEGLRKYAGEEYKIVVKNEFDHTYLDAQLKRGNPVIAKVLWQGKIFHWVLITGKEGKRYLIADPLVPDNPHTKAIYYPTGFFAIRHLEKK